MNELQNIPQEFWKLFRSSNRYTYIEALIEIYDEYLYNDYFMTKETCIYLISEHFAGRLIDVSADDDEMDMDNNEPTSTQIANKLIYFTWLKKVEDYSSFKTNIVIPDYSAAFIETFKKIDNAESQETDIYIQNIYSNLYLFYHDRKSGIELLNTATQNTTKLNRSLQNMLHSMDHFFETLLEKKDYESLLEEHLNGYVEDIVNKKYSLLKTSDNFYKYKNDIKDLLRILQEDEDRLHILKRKTMVETSKKEEEIEIEYNDLIYEIERGISNMEKRISHIDSEHNKYIRATVSRIEYLLSNDSSIKGNIIALFNIIGSSINEKIIQKTSRIIQLNDFIVNSEDSFYVKRARRQVFEKTVVPEEYVEELSKEDILKANKSKKRYSKVQIESFITENMDNGVYKVSNHVIENDQEFDFLVLAYDHSFRKDSPFKLVEEPEENIKNGRYSYPNMTFILKNLKIDTDSNRKE